MGSNPAGYVNAIYASVLLVPLLCFLNFTLTKPQKIKALLISLPLTAFCFILAILSLLGGGVTLNTVGRVYLLMFAIAFVYQLIITLVLRLIDRKPKNSAKTDRAEKPEPPQS